MTASEAAGYIDRAMEALAGAMDGEQWDLAQGYMMRAYVALSEAKLYAEAAKGEEGSA